MEAGSKKYKNKAEVVPELDHKLNQTKGESHG